MGQCRKLIQNFKVNGVTFIKMVRVNEVYRKNVYKTQH